MVGIAGKSKGCHTCRRRKVKCDEGKPFCERCHKASRQCEGYEKLAVFLNKTSTGWMKRKPMEEIICPVPANPAVSESTMLNQQINLTPTWLSRIEEYFLEKYLSTGDIMKQRSLPGYHVFQILSEITRDPLLESTIEALCLTRVGRINKDDRLLQAGFQSYSLAIQRLYVAMSRESTRYSDSTLASVRIMSIYEFYEPSYSDGRAVYNHSIAVERLLYGRAMTGYGRHITPAIKSLLKSSRYNSVSAVNLDSQKETQNRQMVASIRGYSSNCPFAQWKMPGISRNSIEEYEHELLDAGFMIAAIVRDYNFSREKLLSGNDVRSDIQELTRKCCQVYVNLHDWYASLAAWCPSILYQQANYSGSNNELHSHLQHLKFADIVISHLLNDYWALTIIVCWTIRQLSLFLTGSALFDHLREDKHFQEIHELAVHNDDNKLLTYAENILCSVQFSFRSNSGLAGQDHLFGLGIAIRFSRMVTGLQAENLGQKILSILEKLIRDGLPFASCLIEQAEIKLSHSDQLMQNLMILPELRWGNGHED